MLLKLWIILLLTSFINGSPSSPRQNATTATNSTGSPAPNVTGSMMPVTMTSVSTSSMAASPTSSASGPTVTIYPAGSPVAVTGVNYPITGEDVYYGIPFAKPRRIFRMIPMLSRWDTLLHEYWWISFGWSQISTPTRCKLSIQYHSPNSTSSMFTIYSRSSVYWRFRSFWRLLIRRHLYTCWKL